MLCPFAIKVLLAIFARTFCALCKQRICNKNNSLLCITCSESFHKKCLKLTPKTCNKYHVSKNFLCVGSAFKNLPFYQSSDSSDYFSTGPKSDFPSNDQLKFVNNCNSLEIIRNNEEDIFKTKSKYFTINEFLNFDLNDNTLKPILDALLKQGVLRLFQQDLFRLGTTLFSRVCGNQILLNFCKKLKI